MADSGLDTQSLKHRLRKTICCCFPSSGESSTAVIRYRSAPTTPTSRRSSPQWLRSRSNEFPEFKDRCRSFISRICVNNHHRRRSHSTDFRYDPLSYSLNFQEGNDDDGSDEFLPLRSFTARLPQSPVRLTKRLSAPAAPQISAVKPVTEFPVPQRTTSDGAMEMRVGVSREITAYS